MSGSSVEFRVLGPLEVLRDGTPVKLGGPKQRGVLALLLLNANRVVATERFVDEVWGDDPPESVRRVVQVYVAEVRKLVANDRAVALVTRAPGYALELGSGRLDLHRFEQQISDAERDLADGRAEPAAAGFREALALWRGPPLGDLAHEPFAAAEIARLEELRLVALEKRVEADLALGRHVDLVPELEGLVAEYPLRERVRGQLMLALYRSGRQADALARYREARERLVEELGIEPGPVLRALEQAILQQDAKLDLAATPAETEEPAPRAILVLALAAHEIQALVELAEPLALLPPVRELLVACLVEDAQRLATAARVVNDAAEALRERQVTTRSVAFTSADLGQDAVRLARAQDVDLILTSCGAGALETGTFDAPRTTLLSEAPCDVALVCPQPVSTPAGPVLVPFSGADNDWSAIELAAWMARAGNTGIVLAGAAARPHEGRRDASRMLADASLIVQRYVGVTAEPLLIGPGSEDVIEASRGARAVVLGLTERWQSEGLGPARLAIARSSHAPTLLLKRGLRPSGLAPSHSLTRYTWSLGA